MGYVLHVLPGAWGLPSVCPRCIELEAYLRWRRVPYHARAANPMTLPYGRAPALTTPDGSTLGDVRRIVQRLERDAPSPERPDLSEPLDAARDRVDLARLHAVARLATDSLAWWLEYFRWKDRRAAKETLAGYARGPGRLGAFARAGLKKRARAELWAQGAGRLDADEAFEHAKADVRALVALLGAGPYFGGPRPATADAATYGVLAALLYAGVETPLKGYAQSQPRLTAYARRVRTELFPVRAPASPPDVTPTARG